MLFIDGNHAVGKTGYWLPEVKATELSGDLALQLRMPRTATVTAISPCPDSSPVRSLGRRGWQL